MAVKVSAGDMVWWKCRVGHEWQATINQRNNGKNCPRCAKEFSSSFPEQAIYFYLKDVFDDAINRYKCDGKEIDIYLPSINLGIEYDGVFYHPIARIAREDKKDDFFQRLGIRIIHIKETTDRLCDIKVLDDVIYFFPDSKYKNLEKVIRHLLAIMNIGNCKDICIDSDKKEIYNELFTYIKVNSIATNNDLLLEWNYEKNGGLNPEYVSLGSNFAFWWKCKNNHEWEATVSSRSSGNGCPYCSNQKVLKGYNDVATTDPELLREWDYEKNTIVTPYSITRRSHKKVWWKCVDCGHEWRTDLANRTAGTGCPQCKKLSTSRKLSLAPEGDSFANSFPSIAHEWHPTKNGDCTPYQYKVGSKKRAWWICKKGHEWEAIINSRTLLGSGCPYCSNQKVLQGYNDVATTNPGLVQEWDFDKNSEISPYSVTQGSGKIVWWKCSTCNHEWKAAIKDRSRGNGCPKCKESRKKTQRQPQMG